MHITAMSAVPCGTVMVRMCWLAVAARGTGPLLGAPNSKFKTLEVERTTYSQGLPLKPFITLCCGRKGVRPANTRQQSRTRNGDTPSAAEQNYW